MPKITTPKSKAQNAGAMSEPQAKVRPPRRRCLTNEPRSRHARPARAELGERPARNAKAAEAPVSAKGPQKPEVDPMGWPPRTPRS